MGSQIQLTISVTMIVLFSIAIFGFTIEFANDNEAIMNVGSDTTAASVYNLQKDNSSQFSTESEDTYTSILESTIGEGSDTIPSAAPFAPSTRNLISSTKNIITLPIQSIFGGWGSPFGIFFTALLSIITFMFGLYLWKTLRGNP